MSFKILYVTATLNEAEALKKIKGILTVNGVYRIGNLEIALLVAGVGSISTAWNLNQWLSKNGKPDLAINGGIAGSFNDEFNIGDVVMPIADCFADSGIEDGESFLTLFEAGFVNSDEFPFKNGIVTADTRYSVRIRQIVKPVRAITVNTATGTDVTRNKLKKKFNPDIETMEGATFFYICAREKIPFLALRSISNRIELRNKDNWNIKLALDNLSEKLSEIFITLE